MNRTQIWQIVDSAPLSISNETGCVDIELCKFSVRHKFKHKWQKCGQIL